MAKKNNAPESYRLHIQFNMEDELQRQCINFLGLCGYRKNQILALMVKEFIEVYNFDLDSITADEIKVFLDSYQYIQKFKKQSQCAPAPAIPDNAVQPTADNTSPTNSDFNDTIIDNEQADKALAAFGL